MHELISTLKKKKCRWGMLNILPKSLQARKKPATQKIMISPVDTFKKINLVVSMEVRHRSISDVLHIRIPQL